jgi:signal transduction histidine kinase
MLDLSQIKSGKFRKIIKEFDIRKSVEKVMSIQRKQANEKGLDFTVEFHNIAMENDKEINENFSSSIIKCDENRIM